MNPNVIFVFGSNLAGRHGKGAALHALKEHKAVYGQAIGLQGTSYAIPTKDEFLKPLPIDTIRHYADRFIAFANLHPELEFEMSRVGCGLAGYTNEQMSPLFAAAPSNVLQPRQWSNRQ